MTQGGRAQNYRSFTNRAALGEYKRPLDCEASSTCTQAELDAYYGTGAKKPTQSIWDTVNHFLETGGKAWTAYNQGQNAGNGGGSGAGDGGNGGGGNGGGAPDNTVKYVLVGVGILAAAGITYAVISSTKKAKAAKK